MPESFVAQPSTVRCANPSSQAPARSCVDQYYQYYQYYQSSEYKIVRRYQACQTTLCVVHKSHTQLEQLLFP